MISAFIPAHPLVAEQQVKDLKQRLAENEAHRQSLEEKHRHARQALEHYRRSIKEQREADIRRHEQHLHTHATDTEHQLSTKIAEAELLAEQLAAANDQVAPLKSRSTSLSS